MAKQKIYTVWGSNPEKGNRFDKAEEWIAAAFESEEEATTFEKAEGKNYKFMETSIFDITSGMRFASGEHSARIFCESMSENKAKKELLNLNTRCSAYFKKPIKGGSYAKFDKDGFVEGEGYKFYSNEDNEIHESKNTLNHVLLFEQFINESNLKIKVKGKTIKVDYDSIEIEGIDTRDYPDFSDAFISYAEDHRGRELTDEELDVINDEHYHIIGELIFDKQLYM